jgi:predicted N-acetyltransferase YhbS
MTAFQIRPARVDEAEALSALCLRSKAHWGYDAQFLRLSAEALTLTPHFIAQGRVLVAEDGGALVGIVSTEPMEAPGTFDLVHLFVEPAAFGRGVGRVLFEAAAQAARREGGLRLSILADPNAAEFYHRMGARDMGDAPSDAIPGRRLPLLEYAIADAPPASPRADAGSRAQ